MSSWLTLDLVAKRYGCLPSEVLVKGDSVDVAIADLSLRYENYVQKKAEAEQNGGGAQQPSHEQMTSMIERVRGRNNDSKATQDKK